MTINILTKNDYIKKNWSGGETTQLLIYPETASLENRDFIFRISSATCPNEESQFSDFSGYQRYITPLNKDFRLRHNGKDLTLKPFEILYFDGADDTASLSEARDFNLIIKKGYTATYRTESISNKTEFNFDRSGIKFIFIPEGNIKLSLNGQSTNLEVFNSIFIKDTAEKIYLESIDKKFSRVIIIEVEVD